VINRGGAERFLVFVCEILTEPDHLENEEAKSLDFAAGNCPYRLLVRKQAWFKDSPPA